MKFVKLFFSTLLCFLVLDAIWLGFIAKDLYGRGYGSLLRRSIDGSLDIVWPAALLVYFFLVLGIIFFVVKNARQNWLAGLGWGALFGLITYGVYDWTCYAIFANWPFGISVIDNLWGAVLCALVGGFVSYIDKLSSH